MNGLHPNFFLLKFIGTVLFLATTGWLKADINNLPPGYSIRIVSSNVTASSISQRAFKPGDLTHVYAARSSPSRASRYDYNPVTGVMSNQFTVATNADNKQLIRLGFPGTTLYAPVAHRA